MIQFRFETTKDLFDFIQFVPDFMAWNILECVLETNDGTINNYNINIHRKVRDGSSIVCLNDSDNYDKFMKVVSDVKNNYYRGIKFDLFLQAPIELKNSMDLFDEFKDFFLCLYTDDKTIICSTHFSEKNKDHGINSIQLFDSYITQLYTEWVNSKVLQN